MRFLMSNRCHVLIITPITAGRRSKTASSSGSLCTLWFCVFVCAVNVCVSTICVCLSACMVFYVCVCIRHGSNAPLFLILQFTPYTHTQKHRHTQWYDNPWYFRNLEMNDNIFPPSFFRFIPAAPSSPPPILPPFPGATRLSQKYGNVWRVCRM